MSRVQPLPNIAHLPPRERILIAAERLFAEQGLQATGVDAIAHAAGTNKMTLYRHFESKDHLIVAYLRRLIEASDSVWEDLRERFANDPRARLSAWLKLLSDFATEHGSRGCTLSTMAVELRDADHPARKILEEYNRTQWDILVDLCRQSGVANPEKLADEVFLLTEGARISRQSAGPHGPGSRLLALAEGLLPESG